MKGPDEVVSYDGRTQTIAVWAKEVGITPSGLNWRLDNGWSVERALGSIQLQAGPGPDVRRSNDAIDRVVA
jgi:hypothetical protein